MTAEDVIRLLGLEPLAIEGGHFAETWRSTDRVTLPARYRGERALGTAIYYLLTPGTFSEMHRLPADEVFHFYLGDPAEMLHLLPGGTGRLVTIGTDLAAGMRPQVVAPAGAWQGSRLVPGGAWALLGTTMAPGFDPADYERGARAALLAGWPEFRGGIEALTRS
jgi:hypothetical protein